MTSYLVSDSEDSDPGSILAPAKKKRHVDSKYQAEWSHLYRMAPSSKGETFAFCKVCCVDFSVAGGGVHQVKRHCSVKKHVSKLKELRSQPTIQASLASHQSTQRFHDQVTCAELYFARFVTEHNLPFAVADHFNKLCSVMFPDSKIASEFACARTKTAALVTHALAPAINEPIIKACQEQPFTILCDGGNDNYEKKYFGIMVRFWNERLDKVVTRFLGAPIVNIATGENLFNAMSKVLEMYDIPWRNVIGFASDSASVMVGRKNSVLSRVIQQQHDVFSMGCVCHLAALCAAAGLKKLPVSVDDLLIDVFYHFKHSSKRCEEFSIVVKDFDGIAPVRVLKHCSTRWLSLERAVNRLLQLWPALFAYFDREGDKSDRDRVKRVSKAMSKVETKLYCQFVAFALKPLNAFNTAFQTSASKIGTLQHDIRNLLRGFLSNFIQPQILAAVSNDDIHSFNYEDTANQLCNDELGIGTAARLLLLENSDELEGTRREDDFFFSIRHFYMECVRKMIIKFPFTDCTVSDLGMLNPHNRHHVSTASVTRLLKRFYKQCSIDDMDTVLMELREYKSLPESQLPEHKSLEDFWARMGVLPKPAGAIHEKRFGHLANFCKLLLVLPHSTADPERLFSVIGKVDTSQRSLLLASTVGDILSVKLNTDLECYHSKELFTPALLRQAKSATKCSVTPAVLSDSD